MGISPVIAVLGILAMTALALAGLVRPFVGLVVLVILHFLQPTELIPALAPFRIELAYGLLVAIVWMLRNGIPAISTVFSNSVFRGPIILLVYATLTVPFAVWKGGALEQVTVLAKLVVIMVFLGTLIETEGQMKFIVWVLVGLLAWYAGSAITAYTSGDFAVGEGLDRAVGESSIVGDPNALGGLIIALIPFLVAAFHFSRKFFPRLALMIIALLAFAALAVTGSRTSLLALMGIAIYYIYQSRRKLITLSLITITAIVFWLGLPAKYQQRYFSTVEYAQGKKLDESNQLRLRVWEAGLRMFIDHPILGVGAGQFPTAYGLTYSSRRHGAWMQPHNLIIQTACELGVIGLFIFGSYIVRLVKANGYLLQLDERAGFEVNYNVAVACGALFFGAALASMFGHTLYRPYWYILGGFVAANQLLARKKADVTKEEPGAGRESMPMRDDMLTPEPLLKGDH
ncbi:MAG TPA: O-antigen ligase family protein [Terriglobia bacterium]|nr:O-antigen ligase family protein [Terriglobia bacterium]